MSGLIAKIYTDGSCHTQLQTGTWVAIIFVENKKEILSASVPATTHQRMELTAVIKSLQFLRINYPEIKTTRLFTDSQYVAGLRGRKEKLIATNFISHKGSLVQNADLVKIFFDQLSLFSIEITKVKAHEKKEGNLNYNREADMLARKLLREAVKGNRM